MNPPRWLLLAFLISSVSALTLLTATGKTQPKPASKKPSATPAPAKLPTVAPAKEVGTVVKTPPNVTAKSVIVINGLTGQPLFSKNSDEKRAVASTQKLMTALLICEAGNLDRLATANEFDAAADPTKIYLKPGLQYPRRDLLRALLMKSANDTARCLAHNQAGTEPEFAKLMNRRAKTLGMINSHFENASGLPAPQYSTARDMSLLARAAYHQPVIRGIISTAASTFSHPDGRTLKIHSTNHLLGVDPYCNGMKTGFTDAAGKCLICSGTHKGRTVIIVLLGSSADKIWGEAKSLLHWGLGVP
jgi:serine-type D-Ala-D-Ala carboxypeptidase (penicillin-binding protein 5/6)